MSFGLTNSPTTFMDLKTQVLRQILDLFIIVFIDDILVVYFKSEENYTSHLQIVL